MKKSIRIISLILCVVTLLLCFAGCGKKEEIIESLSQEEQWLRDGTLIQPSQNDNFKYNVYTTYIEITGYLGTNPSVVIPEKIEDKPVLVIAKNCFYNNKIVTSIKMADSVIRIDNGAFASCLELVELVLSKNIKEVPTEMCAYNAKLENVEIPENVVTIGSKAFANCTSITEVIIPKKTRTIMVSAFSGCEKIERLIILDGDIVENNVLIEENPKTIQDVAFSGLKNAKEIVIPDSVETLGQSVFIGVNEEAMFYGYVPSAICTYCASLENRYQFTEIKEGDKFDKLIKQRVIPTETTGG